MVMRMFTALSLVLAIVGLLGPLPSTEAADPRPPFTADRSPDFKPLGLKGHENCAKHFYAHEMPHEGHMEHGATEHPPGHMK